MAFCESDSELKWLSEIPDLRDLRADLMLARCLRCRRVCDLRTRYALKYVWMVRAAMSRRFEIREGGVWCRDDSKALIRCTSEVSRDWVCCFSFSCVL